MCRPMGSKFQIAWKQRLCSIQADRKIYFYPAVLASSGNRSLQPAVIRGELIISQRLGLPIFPETQQPTPAQQGFNPSHAFFAMSGVCPETSVTWPANRPVSVRKQFHKVSYAWTTDAVAMMAIPTDMGERTIVVVVVGLST